MAETMAYGYSSESSQKELSNEYQYDRVQMFFKNLCVLLLWMKVDSALEGLEQVSQVSTGRSGVLLLTSQCIRQSQLPRPPSQGLGHEASPSHALKEPQNHSKSYSTHLKYHSLKIVLRNLYFSHYKEWIGKNQCLLPRQVMIYLQLRNIISLKYSQSISNDSTQ